MKKSLLFIIMMAGLAVSWLLWMVGFVSYDAFLSLITASVALILMFEYRYSLAVEDMTDDERGDTDRPTDYDKML